MLHLHSILRYAVLALLIIVVIKSLMGLISKKEYTEGDNKLSLMLLIFTHLQLVLGLLLYFTHGWAGMEFGPAMKVAELRFWKVEHLAGMLIAVILITIGRARSKRISESVRKHRVSLIFFGIALILILQMIPWEATRLY